MLIYFKYVSSSILYVSIIKYINCNKIKIFVCFSKNILDR